MPPNDSQEVVSLHLTFLNFDSHNLIQEWCMRPRKR